MKKTKDIIGIAIGSASGLGLSPIFPGTCGALFGVCIHFIIVSMVPLFFHWTSLLIVFILTCLAHYMLTPWAVAYWSSQDPKNFVLDEVAGYLWVQILFRHEGQFWKIAGCGFVIFRIFDIFKLIPPTRYVDKNIHGALGILLDDLISASYAALMMYILTWLYPQWLK